MLITFYYTSPWIIKVRKNNGYGKSQYFLVINILWINSQMRIRFCHSWLVYTHTTWICGVMTEFNKEKCSIMLIKLFLPSPQSLDPHPFLPSFLPSPFLPSFSLPSVLLPSWRAVRSYQHNLEKRDPFEAITCRTAPSSLVADVTDAALGATGLWLGTRTGADGKISLIKSFFARSPWPHGQQVTLA